jgi:hypothetical protein
VIKLSFCESRLLIDNLTISVEPFPRIIAKLYDLEILEQLLRSVQGKVRTIIAVPFGSEFWDEVLNASVLTSTLTYHRAIYHILESLICLDH